MVSPIVNLAGSGNNNSNRPSRQKQKQCQWRKHIPTFLATLLANELMISLMSGWKHTPEKIDQKSFTPPNANAFTAFEELAVVAPPKSKVINTPGIDVNVSVSDSVDDLQLACLSFNNKAQMHHISYRAVYGSWSARTEDRHSRQSFHLASRKNNWVKTSFVTDGIDISTTITNFSSPVMFIPAIFDPSQCIGDLIFSLLPMASQGKLRDFEAVAVERPDSAPDFPVKSSVNKGDFCTHIMKGLGWFKNITTVPDNTCVDNLWVPAFMYHRYPRGTKGWEHGGKNEYIHNEDLPLPMMRFWQQQMWKSFLASNKYMYKKKQKRIIFDCREGEGLALGAGEWTNARQVAEMIQEQLDPEMFVVEVMSGVGALSLQEQAALFTSAAIFVAPHGGTLANAIFMKPRSIVFEISCGQPSWIREWVTDMGLRHSVIKADEPPCMVEGRRTYAIQPSSLVDLILDICWNGLKKKKEPS